MARFLNNAPQTEEGAKLKLTEEQKNNCKVVYKLKKNDGAIFAEFWNPETEYSNEYIVLPLGSSYDGTEMLTKNTTFANVKGSTPDPKPWVSSWIELYRDKVGPCDCCCAEANIIYNSTNNSRITGTVYISWKEEATWHNGQMNPFKCGSRLSESRSSVIGGHVVKGTINKEPRRGESGIYILPICDHHNTCKLEQYAGNFGLGYYMKLAEDTRAVKLRGYLDPPQVEKMLSEAESNASGE